MTTSEVSLSITANDRPKLERAAAELSALGDVKIESGRAILVVVGQHLAERPGLGADILGAVAKQGVNVEMISHSFGAINLSIVVKDADISRTVSVLHDVLFEAKP